MVSCITEHELKSLVQSSTHRVQSSTHKFYTMRTNNWRYPPNKSKARSLVGRLFTALLDQSPAHGTYNEALQNTGDRKNHGMCVSDTGTKICLDVKTFSDNSVKFSVQAGNEGVLTRPHE